MPTSLDRKGGRPKRKAAKPLDVLGLSALRPGCAFEQVGAGIHGKRYIGKVETVD